MSIPAHREVAPPGTLLARKYRVERVLGTGGMGVVVAAKHVQLDEHVAIKLLHPEVAQRSGAIDRFLREARVAMKLRGEHVVRIHDIGTTGEGVPFIVMEYLEGSDLGSRLREHGPMPIADAVDAVLQACVGVAEAHSIGVVHRDLKPPNLFLASRVDRTPCVKVLDFGISKLLRDASGAHGAVLDDTTAPISLQGPLELADTRRVITDMGGMTASHAVMGSPRYMAPEQMRSARDVDARADVWSLGVILYELTSGVPPFDEDDLEGLRRAILERRPRPLRMLCDAPPGLEAAIDKCLAKEAANRFQNVHALAEALAPFGSSEGRVSVERIARMVRGRSAALPVTVPHDEVAAPRARWRVVVPFAAVVLAVMGIAGLRRVAVQGAVPDAQASRGEVMDRAVASGEVREVPEVPEVAEVAEVRDVAPSPVAEGVGADAGRAASSRARGTRPTAIPARAGGAARDESRGADPLRLDGGFLFDEQH